MKRKDPHACNELYRNAKLNAKYLVSLSLREIVSVFGFSHDLSNSFAAQFVSLRHLVIQVNLFSGKRFVLGSTLHVVELMTFCAAFEFPNISS